jgi:chromosomal replication initiation ATPase DnaA
MMIHLRPAKAATIQYLRWAAKVSKTPISQLLIAIDGDDVAIYRRLADGRIEPVVLEPRILRSWDTIVEAVTKVTGTSERLIKSVYRSDRAVRARHYCFLLARRHTMMSLPEVGRICGNRHHATVMHGCRAIQYRIGTEERCASEWTQICTLLDVPD